MGKLTGPESVHAGAPPPWQLTGHVKTNTHRENLPKAKEELIPTLYMVPKAD